MYAFTPVLNLISILIINQVFSLLNILLVTFNNKYLKANIYAISFFYTIILLYLLIILILNAFKQY